MLHTLNRTIWLMGPTSSGKTTLARFFVHQWRNCGQAVIHYDGDEIRDFFGPSFGFSPKDRFLIVKTLAYLANKASDAGMLCIVSALTANQDARDYISEHIPAIITAYVECSLEECAKRDPKGLYKKAKQGKIDTLIGWNTPYQAPVNPDLRLNTEHYKKRDLFEQLDKYIESIKPQTNVIK